MICLNENVEINNSDEIQRVDGNNLSYSEFVMSNMVLNRPVIIQLNLKDWESYQNWFQQDESLDTNYLRAKIGDVMVPIAKCSERYFNAHATVELSLDKFLAGYWELDSAIKHHLLYLKDWHLRKQRPNYEFYKVPEFFCSDFLNEFLDDTGQQDYKFVYIGKKDTYTPFHSDVFSSYSWSVNLRGRKRWYFLPPGEELKLRDSLGNFPFLVTPEMMEEKGAKFFTIIQESQEAIFVPSNWFHQVHNELDTVSINHNWFNACNLDKVWEALTTNLNKVKEEITAYKGVETTDEKYQIMLKSHFGMDFDDFLAIIDHATTKRAKAIDANQSLTVGGFSFDESHLIFDLKRVFQLVKQIKENADIQILNLNEKCDKILETIENVGIKN